MDGITHIHKAQHSLQPARLLMISTSQPHKKQEKMQTMNEKVKKSHSHLAVVLQVENSPQSRCPCLRRWSPKRHPWEWTTAWHTSHMSYVASDNIHIQFHRHYRLDECEPMVVQSMVHRTDLKEASSRLDRPGSKGCTQSRCQPGGCLQNYRPSSLVGRSAPD